MPKIYGLQGEKGRAPRDLDSCNGHEDGERGYHYHTTKGFPYVLGCRFHGVLAPNAALRSLDRAPRPGPDIGLLLMKSAISPQLPHVPA